MARDQDAVMYVAILIFGLAILALFKFGEAFELLAQATASFAEGLIFILLIILVLTTFLVTRKR